MSYSKNMEKFLSVSSRCAVWGLLLSIIYMLRAFSLLIFLTFVFGYVQAHGVEKMERYIKLRPLRVVIVGTFLISIIIGLFVFLAPHIREQAVLFAKKLPSYFSAIDHELARLSAQYPSIAELLPPPREGSDAEWAVHTSQSAQLVQNFVGVSDTADIGKTVSILQSLGTSIVGVISAFLLSLLFSFLIVLDLPKLQRLVSSLAKTRLSFIYEEVADSIHSFGTVLGRALEAQLMIALCNTTLTAIAIHFMGLTGKVAFLSMIVFLCSFVPVVGVFISSFPICVVALQESGLFMVFVAIGVVIAIHTIEAYVLNPRIYGHHLHLNPVVVLIILTVSGKLFGGWGFVLGVPFCTYIFGHAIQRRDTIPEPLKEE